MSQYYNPKRTRNIYDPKSDEPFKLSRSKIDVFLNCQRCFYMDRRLGVDRPPGFPFALNSAVDTLLKKEFDIHRAKKTSHPLMDKYKIDAIPFEHHNLKEWRENFSGVRYHHESTDFIITGAVDDVWVNSKGELMVVDYKSTSKESEVNLEADWQIGYKRQMEVYQWLLRKNGHKVSDIGYFVYCNGKTDREAFDGKLDFDVTILNYKGDDSWIEPALGNIKKCLDADIIPLANSDCDYCAYRKAAGEVLNKK